MCPSQMKAREGVEVACNIAELIRKREADNEARMCRKKELERERQMEVK